jgi:hypothetical protein
MKKVFFTLAVLFSVSMAYSQWSFEKVSNGFDDPYRIAYTSANNSAILKLENVDESIFFYIQGGYYCDDYPSVDLVFVINGENIKYNIEGMKNDKNDVVFFTTDLVNNEMFDSFKKCSVLKVRINETYCDTDTYSFNMSKSTSAVNFIIGK